MYNFKTIKAAAIKISVQTDNSQLKLMLIKEYIKCRSDNLCTFLKKSIDKKSNSADKLHLNV